MPVKGRKAIDGLHELQHLASMKAHKTPNSVQPYGKACLNCSRAKCKCVSRPGGAGCERCHRLAKLCTPGKNMRAANSRGGGTSSQFSQIEGKIDSLVSLLQARQGSAPTQRSVSPDASQNESRSSIPSFYSSDILNSSSLPPEESLAYFRERMLKYFAFIHISEDAETLRSSRPFLFLCIMAVSSQSTKTKIALNKKVKETVTYRMFLDNETPVDIELLLGLLVFIVWGNDSLLHGMPTRVPRLMQLAVTLVFDLRLNKAPPEDSNMLPMGKDYLGPRTSIRSMEEMRAVLGCFLLSSMVSSYFGTTDPLQWTSTMDEYLEILSRSRESAYDELFAHQVRLQRIAGELESAKNTTEVPSSFYVSALQMKMENIKAGISPPLLQNQILLSSIYYTDLILSGFLVSCAGSSEPQRLESMFNCLQTVKTSFDNIFTIYPTEYNATSFVLFMQLARSIVVLFKLSVLKDPAWDLSLVRRTVDLLEVMNRLIVQLSEARDILGDQARDGYLDRAIKIFTIVKSWSAAKFDEVGVGVIETQQAEQPAIDGMGIDNLWLMDQFFWNENDLFSMNW